MEETEFDEKQVNLISRGQCWRWKFFPNAIPTLLSLLLFLLNKEWYLKAHPNGKNLLALGNQLRNRPKSDLTGVVWMNTEMRLLNV